MATMTTAEAIRKHLRGLEPGTVFTPAELVRARLGPEGIVRQTLHRMAKAGTVRRLSKGYYDIPATSPLIGILRPTPEAIIAAHARKTGATIERPELDAANKLGLTTQVVARPVYRTDLFPRDLKIGGQTIRLKTAGPRSLARGGDPTELVIDALRAVGKAHITDKDIAKVREFVREHRLEKKLRQRDRRVPSWMLPVIDAILDEKQTTRG